MQLARIKVGDLATVNVNGRVFEARVTDVDRDAGRVSLDPPRNVTYYTVTARQVQKSRRWKPTDAQRPA